jgi:hypothetical protein
MRQYKIMRVCVAECNFVSTFESFYAQQSMQEKSYDEVIANFQSQGYLYPASFQKSMEKLGNECIDVIADAKMIQKKWAAEKGIPIDFDHKHWMYSALMAQIADFKPDVIYFERSFHVFTHSFRKQLKEHFPFLKLITGFWGAQFDQSWIYQLFKEVDLLFCIGPYFEKAFRDQGVPAHVNYRCFDEEILKRIKIRKKQFLFTFAGTAGYGNPTYINRYQSLLYLLKNTPLEIWSSEPKNVETFKRRIKFLLAKGLSYFPKNWIENGIFKASHPQVLAFLDSVIKKKENAPTIDWFFNKKPMCQEFPGRIHSRVVGAEYFQVMADSKLILNRHTDGFPIGANVRNFEAAGIGGCMLTNRKIAVQDFFEEDKEVVFYSSDEECAEKAHYLLDHPTLRESIGKAAQKRVLKDHTLHQRVTQAHEMILRALSQASCHA